MAKDRIIESLGETHLLLPGLVAGALAANDRVKYLLTLVQTARGAADGAPVATSLREERLASGVDDAALDRVVLESAREADCRYCIPGVGAVADRSLAEVAITLSPLEAAGVSMVAGLRERVEAVSAALAVGDDLISGADVARLTAARGEGGDSLHLVVMDVHRELSALQAKIATESIDGAHVHDLAAGDRTLVRAFMGGVHTPERLKFDHPGLGTIATRTGPTLVIQNDLGETDAHVVVIRAEIETWRAALSRDDGG